MYKINDGNICYSRGYPTIAEAKTDAEKYIRNTTMRDLDDVTIVNEETGKVVSTYYAEIAWDD